MDCRCDRVVEEERSLLRKMALSVSFLIRTYLLTTCTYCHWLSPAKCMSLKVLERCFRSMYPIGLFEDVLNDNPDLYGPFWVTTTVIFTTFVSSSLAASIVAYMHGTPYVYNFGTLSFAVFVLYSYTFGSAFLVWAATKYYGCQPSLLNIINMYGYSMTAWIPVSVGAWQNLGGER